MCGSGLSGVADIMEHPRTVLTTHAAGLVPPSVPGHRSEVLYGTVGETKVLCAAGRVHLYEGYSANQVVHMVRVAFAMGVREVLLTNAAGAINTSFEVGELVSLYDHVNMTAQNPLVGVLDTDRTRFVDMCDAYSARRLALAERCGVKHSGVYAQLLGPSYETPAEIEVLRRSGVDLVGMSTGLEAVAARHLGMEVAAWSLVTNKAAAAGGELSHDEVAEVGSTRAASVLDTVRCYAAALTESR